MGWGDRSLCWGCAVSCGRVIPIELRCRPASLFGSYLANAQNEQSQQQGWAFQIAVPALPPAASPAAPGAACQVSLAMSHVVQRGGLLPAASPRRPASLPPACAAFLHRPPRGSPWPNPAQRSCRAKRPPSPLRSAPWSTTPSSGEGPGEGCHAPSPCQRPQHPLPAAFPWPRALPGGFRDTGQCGEPWAADRTGRVSAHPRTPRMASATLPPPLHCRESPGPHGCIPLGWPLPLWRREGPFGHVDPFCPRCRATGTGWCSELNPVLGLLPLQGVGVLQLLCSPGAANCAHLLSTPASPMLAFNISTIPAPWREGGNPAGPACCAQYP